MLVKKQLQLQQERQQQLRQERERLVKQQQLQLKRQQQQQHEQERQQQLWQEREQLVKQQQLEIERQFQQNLEKQVEQLREAGGPVPSPNRGTGPSGSQDKAGGHASLSNDVNTTNITSSNNTSSEMVIFC